MKNIISKYKFLKKQFVEHEEDPEWPIHYPSYLDKVKDDLNLWDQAFYQESKIYRDLYKNYKQIKSKVKKIFVKEIIVEKVVYREKPPKPMMNCWCSQNNPIYRKHYLN